MFDMEEGSDTNIRNRSSHNPSYMPSSDQIFNEEPGSRYKNEMDYTAKYNASALNEKRHYEVNGLRME